MDAVTPCPSVTPDPKDLEADDLVYVIEESWGGRNFVIAKSVSYEVVAEGHD